MRWIEFNESKLKISQIHAYHLKDLNVQVCCNIMCYTECFETKEEALERFTKLDKILDLLGTN